VSKLIVFFLEQKRCLRDEAQSSTTRSLCGLAGEVAGEKVRTDTGTTPAAGIRNSQSDGIAANHSR
jgi:hypothetical protein